MRRTTLVINLLIISCQITAQMPSGNIQRIIWATKMDSVFTAIDPNESRISEYYYDGFGREFCQTQIGQSPSGKDMIHFKSLDGFGRVLLNHLPFSGSSDSISVMMLAQSNFYRTALRVPHTLYPYSRNVFDSSPSGELLERGSPGQVWKSGGMHSERFSQSSNGGSQVRRLFVNDVGEMVDAGYYAPNSLRAIKSISPHSIEMIQYFNMHQDLVMVAQAAGTSNEVQTYYVYDQFNRLRMVLPPKAVETLKEASSWSLVNVQEDLIFKYDYDGRDRKILQKVPGQAVKGFVYDNMGRVLMIQDGNQRSVGKWWLTLFDHQDRLVCEGVLDDPLHLTRDQWQHLIDSIQHLQPIQSVSTRRNFSGNNRYIYPTWFNPNQFSPMRMYYYDDYDGFLLSVLDTSGLNGIRKYHSGLLTGLRTLVLDSQMVRWVTQAMLYDNEGNIIRHTTTYGNNVGSTSTKVFNLHGQVIKDVQVWSFPSNYTPTSVSLEYSYEYDPAGRMKSEKLLFDGTERILADHEYNDAGYQIETNIGSVDNGKHFLQSLDYSYNIRGWLTHINNAGLQNDKELMLFTEDPETGEYLSSVVFEGLTMNIEQAMASQDIEVDIQDEKQLEFEGEQSNLIRVVSYDESVKVRIDLEGLDSSANIQFNLISGETLQIDLSGLEIEDGVGAQALLDTSIALLATQLAAKGITDPELIAELSERLLYFVRSRMSRAYHNDDSDDLWGLELHYEGAAPGRIPRYDGLISEMEWKVGDTLAPGMKYDFIYDDLSRLVTANFSMSQIPPSWGTQTPDFALPFVQYDENGNILRLKRNGLLSLSSNGGNRIFGPIDDLVYTYDGNRLSKVVDLVGINNTGLPGFASPVIVPLGDHYDYDANGNMITDLNKGIEVDYNALNLPSNIQFPSTSTGCKMIHDASGRKLRQVMDYGNQEVVIDYYDDAIVQDGSLLSVKHPYGRITWVGSTPRVDYDLKDHLGNVRLVISDLNNDMVADVVQEHHYYPFGMEMGGMTAYYGTPNSPYQYNSKERIGAGSLEWYDFGARFYDPQVGRWHCIDPHSERYSNLAPYSSMGNNPNNIIDPDGRDLIVISMSSGNQELRRIRQEGEDIYYMVNESAFMKASTSFTNDNMDYNTILSIWSLRNQEAENDAVDLIAEQVGMSLNITGEMRPGNDLMADVKVNFQADFDNGNSYITESFTGVTGGFGNGTLENGDYTVNNYQDRSPIGWYNAGMNRNGVGFSYHLNPQFETNRSALRIHPDGGVEGTLGCIGLTGDSRDLMLFRNMMNGYINYGHVYLPAKVNIVNNPNSSSKIK